MRVLYFYQYFTTPKGAYSTRVFEFTRRWAKQGVDVDVITSVYDKSDLVQSSYGKEFTVEGVNVRVIDLRVSNKQSFAMRLYSFLAYAFSASFSAFFTRADVVVCSSGPLFVGLPGLLAKFLRGRPFVFEVRDLWPEGAIQLGVVKNPVIIRLAQFFEKLCYRHAAKVVALSPDAADWISKVSGRSDIEVIPNASDNEAFESTAAETNASDRGGIIDPTVIYTGSLGTMNDPSQLIEMAAYLKSVKSPIRVEVYGEGKDREVLVAQCEARGLNNIRFLGGYPKTEVFDAMRRALCAVLIFHRAPVMDSVSPNKFFDALAAGLPVVQSTQGWIKDLLHESGAGITVDRGDGQAMGRAVIELARDGKRRLEMGERAKELALSRFDRGKLAAQYLDLITGIAEKPISACVAAT